MQLQWKELQQVLNTGKHVLLHGMPGFGKTHLASVGVECYKVTLTEETAAAELRGHYIPKGNEFIWHNGPALMAWGVESDHGCRFVADEIDRASGDALTFFFGLLDDPAVAKLTLPSGETVRPKVGFQCIATTNAEDLSSALPPALLSRFSIRIHIDELHPDALATLSHDLRGLAKESITQSGDRYVDFRQWKAFDDLRSTCGQDIAAIAIFGNRAVDMLNSLKLSPSGAPNVEIIEGCECVACSRERAGL